MPIEFYCSTCYAQVITPDETAGKQGRCPNCGAVVTIPTAQQPPQGYQAPANQPAPPPAQYVPNQRKPSDPFKPTHNKEHKHSESVEKQFGLDHWEEKKEEGHWGEDTELSYTMRKAVLKERTQNRLVGPAQTLITLATINIIAVVISVIGLTIYMVVQAQQEVESNSFWIVLGYIVIAVVLMDSTMIIIGGNHMRLARSYSMAYTGAVFAMLPLNLLFFATIPFGIWAIQALNDPELAEGFKRR